MEFKVNVFENKTKITMHPWLAEVKELDIMSQGVSENDAIRNLCDAVRSLVNKEGFSILIKGSYGDFVLVGDPVEDLEILYRKRNNQNNKEALSRRHDLLWVEIFMHWYKQQHLPKSCAKKANTLISDLESLENEGLV